MPDKLRNLTKRQVNAALDIPTAEWLEKRYGGTNKKSWFINMAVNQLIEDVKADKITLPHNGRIENDNANNR